MAVEAHMYSLSRLPSHDTFCFDLKPPLQQLQFQPQQPIPQQQQFIMQDPQQHNSGGFVFSAVKPQPQSTTNEIDGYIHLQNERLKMVLRAQRKQQLSAMLRRVEARTAAVMRRKEEEIASAAKRNAELEEFMRRLEVENQVWKRIAGENESLIANLNAAIAQLRDRASDHTENNNNNNADDAESCCGDNEDEAAAASGTESKRRKTGMVCGSCNWRNSSVLFLPCRHLCCCTACEPFVAACPVCNSPKKGTIEALI